MHTLIDEQGYSDDIKVCCTIYDSIYLCVKCDATIIKWLNDTIIPIFYKNIFKDNIGNNEAEGEIGFNWDETVAISNNASIEEIEKAIKKCKEKYEQGDV